jgi:hypothetical protein
LLASFFYLNGDPEGEHLMMSSPLIPLTIALLGASVGACGNADKRTRSASQSSASAAIAGGAAARTASATTPAQSHLSTDSDNDNDNPGHSRYDSDDRPVLYFGHAASAADGRAIAGLVKRYYAAGAASDGAAACSLIYSLVAESVAEEYGQSPPLRGRTCAVVMSKLFKQRHRELVADVAGLEVTRVRISGDHGLALLRFGPTRERRVLVRRERGACKMGVLLDVGVP